MSCAIAAASSPRAVRPVPIAQTGSYATTRSLGSSWPSRRTSASVRSSWRTDRFLGTTLLALLQLLADAQDGPQRGRRRSAPACGRSAHRPRPGHAAARSGRRSPRLPARRASAPPPRRCMRRRPRNARSGRRQRRRFPPAHRAPAARQTYGGQMHSRHAGHVGCVGDARGESAGRGGSRVHLPVAGDDHRPRRRSCPPRCALGIVGGCLKRRAANQVEGALDLAA